MAGIFFCPPHLQKWPNNKFFDGARLPAALGGAWQNDQLYRLRGS
jgi:hypothetical protein